MTFRSLKKEVAIHEAIAEAIVTVRMRADGMAALARQCFEYACESKRAGKAEYALEMLKVSADLEFFSSDLKQLALEMESGVIIASGFKRAKRLPRAFIRCERILSAMPAPAIGVIHADRVADYLDKVRARLKRVRGRSRKSEIVSVLDKDFGRRSTAAAPEYNALLEEKMRQMEHIVTPIPEEEVLDAVPDVITLRPVVADGLTEGGKA